MKKNPGTSSNCFPEESDQRTIFSLFYITFDEFRFAITLLKSMQGVITEVSHAGGAGASCTSGT